MSFFIPYITLILSAALLFVVGHYYVGWNENESRKPIEPKQRKYPDGFWEWYKKKKRFRR